MSETRPDVQLIANLVVRRPDGRVLFVRHDAADGRWWLPGGDLEPFEHPDERADAELARLGATDVARRGMTHVESFRGRRGWHVVFHYLADVGSGAPAASSDVAWHAPGDLPRTAHGAWEHEAVRRALAAGAGGTG